MKNKLFFLLLFAQSLFSQTLKGHFPQFKNSEVVLLGYEGFATKELAKASTDSSGHWELKYPKTYTGAAILQLKNTTSVIVLLHQEDFSMQWDSLQDFNRLRFSNSEENPAFAKGIAVNQETAQKLLALNYLLALYYKEPTQKSWLQKESAAQEKTFASFLKALPKNSYAGSYLSLRKLLADMKAATEKQAEKENIAKQEVAFKKIDFASDTLWHSGLLKELFTGYYQLLESYGSAATAHLNASNDRWLQALHASPARQQEVADFCFTLLEKKNLTGASEHIALSMLNQTDCRLDEKRTDLFEQYRKLAVGKTAPDISLGNGKTLRSLPARYKLVVFGASWCPNCQTDYPALLGKYRKVKEPYGLEVAYISIDIDKSAFENYYKEAPFLTFCDSKGWETQAAKDYHVFATPTYMLLDADLKILAKIKSPEDLEQWMLGSRQ